MKIEYFKKGVFWLIELFKTLLIFWIKNPTETPAILAFIFGKILASPKFFSRNIFIEKHSKSFRWKLDKTSSLYERLTFSFTPVDQNSYDTFEKQLSKFEILYLIIRKIKPQVVVETGVASGESSGYILKALHDNKQGKLYSIDLPFQWYIYGNHHTLHLDSLPYGEASGYLIPKYLKKRWYLIIGNTYDKLPKLLKKLESVDIFFHDSEHTEKTMTFEFKKAWPYIKKGGFLISDDVEYTKAFNNFSKSIKIKTLKFNNLGIIKK